MTNNPLPHYHITRGQMLTTAVICFLTPLLYLLPNFPFPKGFLYCALISGTLHLFLYVFFKSFFPIITTTLSILSCLNIVLLGFVVHFSGGILSPFNCFFICILISDAIFAVEYPLATIFSIITYMAVVALEFFQILTPVPLTAGQIYANSALTVYTAATTVAFIGFSGFGIKQIMKNLRKSVEMEHEKQQAFKRELAKLDAPSQIGFLVNKIVHDIRGPLGAVSEFIKMIRSENHLTKESDEDCALMIEELKRVSNLINKMMQYVRPGQGLREMICVSNLAETVMSVISFLPGAKKVEFQTTLSKPGTILVNANKEELQQVIFNILKNAMEAASDEAAPTVRISVDATPQQARIVIEDNGPGIPAELLHRLSRETLSTKKDGAGVGLVIAQEIIESHNGRMHFENTAQRGAKVTILIPLFSSWMKKAEAILAQKETLA